MKKIAVLSLLATVFLLTIATACGGTETNAPASEIEGLANAESMLLSHDYFSALD